LPSNAASSFPAKSRHARLWTALERASATVAAYVASCRDAHAAAALYRELSRLSDAELARRGMDRAEIRRLVLGQATRSTDSEGATPDAKRHDPA
jgi:IS1 family transposase